jgi:predicted DNA-binding transcriptional regulator YafY
MKLNRLFEIIYILLQKRSVSAKELAEHFGVSVRTIYRDIDVLSLAGIPLYTEQGKGGGISLLPEFVLNKSILSEQEQSEILSALQGLSNVKTAETDKVLEKLSTIFNRTAINWLEVDFSDWSFTTGQFFNAFKAAILERRIAEFDYYSTFGEKIRRRIEPIQLWFKSKAWYVKGFCLTRQDVRTFKLTRVKNLVLTHETFTERDLLSSAITSETNGHQKQEVILKLRIEPLMAYRVHDEFDEHMIEKQPDGSYIITAKYPEDDWVYGTILSYGEYIEVLEPIHIREIIKTKVQNITKKYINEAHEYDE